MKPRPEPRALTARCICCEHPVSAASLRGINEASQDHTDYVNATANRETDIHFEDARMEALISG